MDGKVRNFFPKDITYHTDYLRLALKMSYIGYHHAVGSIEIVVGNISRNIDVSTCGQSRSYQRTAASAAQGDITQQPRQRPRTADCTQTQSGLKMSQKCLRSHRLGQRTYDAKTVSLSISIQDPHVLKTYACGRGTADPTQDLIHIRMTCIDCYPVADCRYYRPAEGSCL